MISNNGIIVGAGLSGIIAAHVFPRMKIIEASQEPVERHRAVLRFRSNEVGRILGVDFKPVTVNKGIWSAKRHKFIEPNIRAANAYSFKVTGGYFDRSIWNLEQSTRYVAPDNLYEMILDKVYNRTHWGQEITEVPPAGSISTIPMPTMAKFVLREDMDHPEFKFASINVLRYKVKNCNIHQTVYIPDPDTNCYRVSITGDVLIAEFIDNADEFDIAEPFGIGWKSIDCMQSSGDQKYGKISPVDESWRRAFMHKLTVDYKVYSLGRFATWRNILLDDVVKDLEVIKGMIRQDDYGLLRTLVR